MDFSSCCFDEDDFEDKNLDGSDLDFSSCCFDVAEDKDDFDELLVSFNGLIGFITTDLTVTVVAFEGYCGFQSVESPLKTLEWDLETLLTDPRALRRLCLVALSAVSLRSVSYL